MSNLYPGSPIPFPCSAYSLSANLAKSAGFWDTGPEAIGEDMHMFLKCFFATQGCFKAIPVFCPASQCNIQEQTTYQTLLARYTQAKRHMFGCLDWGYVLRRSMFAVLAPGFDSQERNVVLSVPVLGPNDEHSRATLISKIPHLIHRMAEANFAMGHFFSLVAISSFQLVESTHPYVIGAHWLGGWIRFICTMAYVVSLYYYEKYQRWSAIDRWELSKAEKENAGCGQGVMDLGKRSELKYVRRWYQIMDWLLIPLSGVFFLTLPQLHAHSLHLVTDKLDYKVAGKPLISESILGELVTSGSMDSIASLAEADEDKRADSGYFQVPDRYNSNRGENQISHV